MRGQLAQRLIWLFIVGVILAGIAVALYGCRAVMNGGVAAKPPAGDDNAIAAPQQQGGINLAYVSAATGGGIALWLIYLRLDRSSELQSDKEQNKYTLDLVDKMKRENS